jgi:glycosyltransferase involved in cell wall biosynthesis
MMGAPLTVMRILHTVERYPPDNGGGAGEVVKRISEGLARRGHDVTVATTFSPRRDSFEVQGVHVRQFDVRGVLNQSVLGIRGDRRGYLGLVRNGHFEVIMNYAAQTWHSDLMFGVLGTLGAKTVLAACGYSGLMFPRSLLYGGYFRKLPRHLRRYDAVVYHSENYVDKAFGDRHGIRRFRVIPNGVDSAEFQNGAVDFRSTYGLGSRRLLLCVGNHMQDKGHDRVLEALEKIEREDVVLALVGRRVAGNLRSCWKSCRRASVRHSGRILFLDDAPRAHVVAAFREADVFLSGSRVEAFPLVFLEAMAAGLPFVAFPAGNVRELAGGIVVESTAEMARVVEELLHDEPGRRRLGDEGRERQRSRYEWESVVDQYEALYRQLTGPGIP